MHQEGCGGTVLTKKQRKSPILGIHIKNQTSSHTENLSTNFIHGSGHCTKVNESIFSSNALGRLWRYCIG